MKPTIQIVEEFNTNVFNLVAQVVDALYSKSPQEAKEAVEAIACAETYKEAKTVASAYVNIERFRKDEHERQTENNSIKKRTKR